MLDKIESLLTVIGAELESNTFERKDLFFQFLRLPLLLTQKFANNGSLSKAIEYVQNILSSYIYESETEYQFYDKALNYLNKVYLNEQVVDEGVLDQIDEQIDKLEDLFISRTFNTATLVKYYEDLIESDILTDKNYFITNVANRLDEEMKARILSVIPGDENGNR